MKQIVWAMVFVVLGGAMAAQAQSVPPLVNYQGLLTDAAGKPQTGTKKLEFNLYDASTGGNKVWGPQVFDSVPLVNGMFNVILGTTDTNGKSIADAFGAKDRYLGMKVDGGTELAPRQQILSTPFAIRAFKATDADHALKADVAETVQGTNLYVSSDNVSINTNLIVKGGIQSEQNKPAYFVSVALDDLNWSHPYLGCPEGYAEAGKWHIGGWTDGLVRGVGYENGEISAGWMCLCVATDSK